MRPFRSVSPRSFGVQSALVFRVVLAEEVSVKAVEIVVLSTVWLVVAVVLMGAEVVIGIVVVKDDVTADVREDAVLCMVVSEVAVGVVSVSFVIVV